MVPVRVPCPSKPFARVGGGRWMSFLWPVDLVGQPAAGRVYILRPGAGEWELVPESVAIAEAVAYLRATPSGVCEGPSELIQAVHQQQGAPAEVTGEWRRPRYLRIRMV